MATGGSSDQRRGTRGGHTQEFFSRITEMPTSKLSVILLMNTTYIGPDPINDEVVSLLAQD